MIEFVILNLKSTLLIPVAKMVCIRKIGIVYFAKNPIIGGCLFFVNCAYKADYSNAGENAYQQVNGKIASV